MWYQKSAEETARCFQTDGKQGLSSEEHRRRLEENGVNALEQKKKVAPWSLFLRQFTDFMVMVLLAAAVASAAMGERIDALMIAAIIVVNSVLGFLQEYKAERSLAALQRLTEDEARILLDGEWRVIKAEELVVGDVVLLDMGAKVPADLRLTEARHLSVDESILTGEAVAREKSTAALTGEVPLVQRSNMCYRGTAVTAGRGRGVVVATGMNTELGKIARMLDRGRPEPTPLQRQLKELGKVLILLCAAVCSLVAVAGVLLGGGVYEMILTGVSLGVASIPEGLPIVVTICLALGVRRLTAVHAIVRRLPTVETLGCVTCICTDKTGTLTKNRMELCHLYVEGAWKNLEEFRRSGDIAAATAKVIANCHELHREGDHYCGDPTELALVYGLRRAGITGERLERTDEIAFDSERRMMSVAVREGGMMLSLVKGAPDRVLACCRYRRCKGENQLLRAEERRRLAGEAAVYGEKGYRVLALAMAEDIGGREDMERELTFLAFAAMRDPLREDALTSLEQAAAGGVRSIMITGDQRSTALAIGRELGLAGEPEETMTGGEMAELSDGQLKKRLKKVSVIAEASPGDKMRIVSLLRRHGEVCAMTGDGVNDAPALHEADVGIAMGKRGTDVTKDAADLILTDDRFSSIVDAICQGRGIYDNIRNSLRYLLSSNLGEILVMLLAVVLCFPLPMVPLQLLWVNLVTDGLPALALAMEIPDASLMKEPPRKASQGVFGGGLGRKILLRGTLIGVVCFAVYFEGLRRSGDLELARTMTFLALVSAQLFYVLDCRGGASPKAVFSSGNPFLWGTVAGSFLIQLFVIYYPPLGALLGTVPLSGEYLLLSIGFAALPTLFSFAADGMFSKKCKKNLKKRRK